MNKEKIDYVPHIYKVTLRSKLDREHLNRISEAERALIWGGLSTAQKKGYVNRKRRFEERLAREKERQKAKGSYSPPVASSPVIKSHGDLQQGPSLSEWPIRFSERAHRYKITFFNENDKPLKRFFRGNLEKNHSFIKEIIVNNPEYTKAEIRVTQTNKLVEIYP